MRLKKEAPSKNVELDRSMYRTPSTVELKDDNKKRVSSNEFDKTNREARLYNSPEYKKALNDIAIEYNKKIGSGKGNREK